jgi:D-alanine-D-alanine ligase-like ATP-grasp enzyme
MRDGNGYRLLIVSSELERVDATPRRVLLRQVKALQSRGIVCDFVMDPTQEQLECQLVENRYDAIIPIIHYSGGSTKTSDTLRENYSIPLLLEQLREPIVGCSHYVQLLTMDKTVSLQRSGCGVPGVLVTRRMFDRGDLPDLASDSLSFPLFIKPNGLCASLGIGPDSVVSSWEAAIRRIGQVFGNYPDVAECRIEKHMSSFRQFTVGIVGNGPAFVTSIVELVYPDGMPRIYDRENKETHISRRPIQYQVVENVGLKRELEFYATRVFAQLGMRDYARLDFFYDGEPYLHDANSHPTIGNSFSFEWCQRRGVRIEDLLAFPLAAFHFRQLADGRTSRLPDSALDLLPIKLRLELETPAPVTAPPEYTLPHGACRHPERYRAVDGTAVEIEVLRFLEALIALIKPNYVLETGTFFGASAEAMARALAREGRGTMTTIEVARLSCQGDIDGAGAPALI